MRELRTALDLDSSTLTFLCLASYEKGHHALEELKRQGCRVFLLTSLSMKDRACWPTDSIDEIFYLEDDDHQWNTKEMLDGVSHLAKTVAIDRVMALDDFDVEKAALLREHLRLPGLGDSAARFFRDKLAMRVRAQESGIPVPEFTATFNNEALARFVRAVPAPWVLKPRLLAGTVGIKKLDQEQELWDCIDNLGDNRSHYVLESFVPGTIFHVDSIWSGGEMVYAVASAYGTPPLSVTAAGGVFTTLLVERGSADDRKLRCMNESVLKAFGMTDGVSHSEFIRGTENQAYYFLETSARVGGAHISDLLYHATGVDFWEEWAKTEVAAARDIAYNRPAAKEDYAGLLVSLARQEWPDTSSFDESELVWRLKKQYHVGFIVKSSQRERVELLLDSYAERVRSEFLASAPPRDRVSE